MPATKQSLFAGAQVGHVHLKVSNLERSVEFYRDLLGMEVTARFGAQAAFLSYDGYHHHLGLNTWQSEGAPPAPSQSVGLYHAAFVFPNRQALAAVVRRILEGGWHLDGASDHGVSEAVYLSDPDGNGLELYRDRPRGDWPRGPQGELQMVTLPLNVQELLKE